MKCPLCGAEVAEDDLFCGNCGYNLLQDRPEVEEKIAPAEKAPSPTEAPAPSEVPAPELPSAEAAPEMKKEEPAFPLPPAPELAVPAAPAGPAKDNTWTLIIVIAIILLVLLCCCCVTTVAFLGWLGSQPTSWLCIPLM